MGSYSYFRDENLKVKDWNGLLNAFEIFDDYLKRKGGDLTYWEERKKNMLNYENKTISFSCWDDIKLISYWYDDDLLFLELIAPFIEGSVEWDFENNDEGGWVEFQNKECIIHTIECIIHTGQMSWNEWKPLDDIENVDEKLSKAFILNKLGEQN